ncbi:MAG: DNA/RNA nuclease SfsA [Pseudobutyrivibrio sp.]|nr:DNA/RNA nuclease SfsA [Pseudobutyrivibrio sp.]
MKYSTTVRATFLDRPNRFIAHVLVEGKEETVHVKNTGRCRELLLPGVTVILEKASNPGRSTAYDLIAVYKENFGLINIDSQAPNKVAYEWLSAQDFDFIKPEFKYGDSRIDFYMEKGDEKFLMEVKGCTLEIDGQGYFPDAPTERGVKHIHELIRAKKEGYHSVLAFVIQMEGIDSVLPNVATHPEFGTALDEAVKAGVEIKFIKCKVEEDSLEWC